MLCFLFSGSDDFNRKTKITMAKMDAMIMMEMVNILLYLIKMILWIFKFIRQLSPQQPRNPQKIHFLWSRKQPSRVISELWFPSPSMLKEGINDIIGLFYYFMDRITI